MKSIQKSKTIWVNAIVISIAIATAVADVSVVSPEVAAYFVAAVGVLNIVLRLVTKEAIG